MAEIVSLISTLNSLTPLAIIALLVIVLFYQSRNNQVAVAHTEVLNTVKTNDLHNLPEMLAILQRIEVTMGENFAYLRARLNGGDRKH